MGLVLTSVTTAALARILGRRIDELTAAIQDAIDALEVDEEHRASGSVRHVIDSLRGALDVTRAGPDQGSATG